jgi:glycerol-3-phosphate acyltransferase PlsY
LRKKSWLTEAQRKAIHMGSILLPLGLLCEWLPWPRGKVEWRWFLITLTLVAMVIDVVRIHDRRIGGYFRQFFGRMIREHERVNLLGSTYLLIAALLAVEMFPRPVAAAALGFTILGDAMAALVGKAYGRTRLFGKTLEGSAASLVVCLVWAAFLASAGWVSWPVAVAGALVASLVELLPIPLDDNLGMTLFAGYTMKLMGASG